MKKISPKKYLQTLAIILIITIGIIVIAYRQKLSDKEPPRSEIPARVALPISGPIKNESTQKTFLEHTVSRSHLTLIAGDASVQIPFSSGDTLYDALLAAKQEGLLSFSGKEYPSLGFFMTDIGTLHQSSGKYLIYFINGSEASVGASSYAPKDGDIITWKLQ